MMADEGSMTPGDILIVDDEPEVAEELADGLGDDGYRCHLANSTAAALEVVESMRGRIALVITDIRMPGEDGISLTRRLVSAEMGPRRPEVVVITGHASAADTEAALQAGAAKVVRKPFKWQEISAAVEEGLARYAARVG